MAATSIWNKIFI